MMFYDGDHGTWWGWLLMSLGMVVFWGLLIVGFIMLLRSAGNSSSGRTGSGPAAPLTSPSTQMTPEQILADRLARGEIDPTEYAERLATLHGKVNAKVLS